MDLNEWKRLSRSEKERIWDKLSNSEKKMVRRHRKSRSRGHRFASKSGGGGFMPGTLTTFIFRASAAGALLLGAVVFVFPELPISLPFLLLMLFACTAMGFASVVDHQGAILEELREANSRRVLREQREAADQLSKKELTPETTSES